MTEHERIVDELIKDVCDKVNIKYSSTSIDDLSLFSDITWASGLTTVMNADNIFEMCMQKINTGGYQMYMQYPRLTAKIFPCMIES